MNEHLERFFVIQDIPEEERKKYREQLEKDGTVTIGSSSFVMSQDTVTATMNDAAAPAAKTKK
jgi:hypothetical protein